MAARLLRNALFPKNSPSTQEVFKHRILAASSQICNFSSKAAPKAKKKFKSDGSDPNEENLSKKDLALQQALDQITSSFGNGAITWLGRSSSPKNVPVVSTGSFSLDLALGIGGFPKTIGTRVSVKITKNKYGAPNKTAEFELEYGKGISREAEMIDLGLEHKLVAKGGGAFYNLNGQKFRGKGALKQFLAENHDVREEFMDKLREKLIHKVTEEAESRIPDTSN